MPRGTLRPLGCALVLAFVLIASLPEAAYGKGRMINQRKTSLRAGQVNGTNFQKELSIAMSEALGCGGQVDEERLANVERVLLPIWRTLPKNGQGRVERRSLRYLTHRYFNLRSALLIRGFEPSRSVSSTSWGSADILSQRVPAYVESVLESKHAEENGFDLKDAAYMVATVQQLIFDSEIALLERVYNQQQKSSSSSLQAKDVGQLLEAYLVHWMMGEDTEGINILLANRSMLDDVFPHWSKLVDFVHGQITALSFKRQHSPRAFSRQGHNALSPSYDFTDVHEVVGGITNSFASYWESECASMKTSLVEMDPHHTGRVPLSKFYGSALDSEWRFGESEAYLRDLGALDETSSWRGKQVIIPNYIQAASNCIVSTPHYLVCCINDCEALLGEIENAIQAPAALPGKLMAIVGNLTHVSQSTLDEEAPPRLEGALATQLEQIAVAHGGKVPLHGRLFGQWLHYAFPRECAFPHKTGTANSLAPAEFGEQYIASDEEMKKHAHAAPAQRNSIDESQEIEWMSQWSEEEELIAVHAESMRAPWERHYTSLRGTVLLLVAVALGIAGFSHKSSSSSDNFVLPTHGKAHFV